MEKQQLWWGKPQVAHASNHGVFGEVKGKRWRTMQLISVKIHKQLSWEVLRLLALM